MSKYKNEVSGQIQEGVQDFEYKKNLRKKNSLSKEEFQKSFELIQKKYGRRMDKPEGSFSISIGGVDIIFNMNNV